MGVKLLALREAVQQYGSHLLVESSECSQLESC